MANPRILHCDGCRLVLDGRQDAEFDFRFDGTTLQRAESELLRCDIRDADTDEMAVHTWAVSWQSVQTGATAPETYLASAQVEWGTGQWGQSARFDVGWGGLIYVRGSWVRVRVANPRIADVDPDVRSQLRFYVTPCASAGQATPLTLTTLLADLAPSDTAEVVVPPWAILWRIRAANISIAQQAIQVQQLSRRTTDRIIADPITLAIWSRLDPDGGILRLTHTGTPATTVQNPRVTFGLSIGVNQEV